ncbi:MAG: hypothetical protein KDC33_07935 [Thermoleophilia bacterium]|nr:hypothetical protein [Thermoleophilia bacterium]
MSGIEITPAPTPEVAAAIVAALGTMGGGTTGAVDRSVYGWAVRARRDEVWACTEMFETWGVGGETR